tara:strand:- start:475 stop:918 length:444 start_codon:yes stop_codon:yes gene_type:complete
MAKIDSYSTSTPTANDLLLGSDSDSSNATKNFLISDLLSLFSASVTLQEVLDAGNTATKNVNLTGDITQTGNNVQTGNYGLTGIFTLESAGSMVLFGGFRAASSFEAAFTVKLTGLSTYADNAAALAGGLAVNNVYKTASGELRIVV